MSTERFLKSFLALPSFERCWFRTVSIFPGVPVGFSGGVYTSHKCLLNQPESIGGCNVRGGKLL